MPLSITTNWLRRPADGAALLLRRRPCRRRRGGPGEAQYYPVTRIIRITHRTVIPTTIYGLRAAYGYPYYGYGYPITLWL